MEIDRDEIVAGLEDAGLSEYEAEAYLTLLERGTSKAVDVARQSSIPVPRIYDVVNELERRGYVDTLDRDTLHVHAHEPVTVIEDLHDRSERLSNVASEIEDRWEQTPVSEHDVTVTKRSETVIDHASELIREADASVDLAFEAPLASLSPSDVVVRVSLCREAGVDDVLGDRSVRETITEVRERAFPSPLVVVVDGETTCYAPTGTVPDPFGVILKGDHLTFVFRWYFQTCLWGVWEDRAADTDGRSEFASLEELICEVYEPWTDGERIEVAIDGVDTDTGEWVSVAGRITDVRYTGRDGDDEVPSLTDLAGEASIVVANGEHEYTVGSWGARVEDVEARRIELFDDAAAG
ncbi:hypothetical protein GCM10028857_13970 [Salinarchaeum chitinilyticum]